MQKHSFQLDLQNAIFLLFFYCILSKIVDTYKKGFSNMNVFFQLLNNTMFMSAVSGWFIAQVLKTIIYGIINKSFRADRLMGSGGMHSSH